MRELFLLGRQGELSCSWWRTCGFAEYCVLMNSDVLVVTRALRSQPGVRAITHGCVHFDDLCLRRPGVRHAGAIAMGRAQKG